MTARFYRQRPFHRRVIPMTSKKRCTVCRQYLPKEEMEYTQGLTNVCSSECLSEYMGKRRAGRRKQHPTPTSKTSRLTPKIPIEIRAAVHTRDGNLCRNCGAKGTQCHHVVFRSQRGSDDLSNLILLCSHCHLRVAHGPESRRYRELFRGYIWLRMVENVSLFVPDLQRRLELSETAA